MWARRGVATAVCPKSYISGESAAWVEMFAAYKQLGFPDVRTMGAREAEAMLILQQEYGREADSGEQ